MLNHQIEALLLSLDRVNALLDRPVIAENYRKPMKGRFARAIGPLKHHLKQLEPLALVSDQLQLLQAWQRYLSLKQEALDIFGEALDFFGGVAVRDTGLEEGNCVRAEWLIQDCVDRMGASWNAMVIPSKGHLALDEMTQITHIIHLPIPHWHLWYLPLVVHDFGLLLLANNVNPELSTLIKANSHVLIEWIGIPSISETTQQSYLAHLVADAIATFCLGPAYAYALLFLILDPTNPYLEGVWGSRPGRSVSAPADARRLALVMQTLQAMSERTKSDEYVDGLYEADLRFAKAVWQDALKMYAHQDRYSILSAEVAGLGSDVIKILELEYSHLADETADRWKKSLGELVPLLEIGTDHPVIPVPELPLLINAAWWVRARHPDRIESLTRDCDQLLHGKHPPLGLNARAYKPDQEATRLLHSRLYDLEKALDDLRSPLSSPEIEVEDRNAVSGRLYRLLSDQDYALKKARKFYLQGTPLDSSLSEVLRQSGDIGVDSLRMEVLEFLGGILVRSKDLDEGACAMAEALLRDYSIKTGVNWNARAILGRNPLFSPASELIHIQFPDWDIWNLPLMAHEFGHVTAFGNQPFLALQATELARAILGHPEVGGWDEDDTKDYLEARRRHLHEFFADAFAVYCQGPAFVYNVLWLHFNPLEAYLPRGTHPTYAERMVAILEVLTRMNEGEKADQHEPGPYSGVINQLKDWWDQSVTLLGAKPDLVYQFHKLKAGDLGAKLFNLLDRYFRLGAQYQAKDWLRAVELSQVLLIDRIDLSGESRCDLLNIAWACRVRHPDRAKQIEKIVLSVYPGVE